MNKEIMIFGAGNIGRSFLTPLFLDGGYRVTLVDINESLLALLDERGSYPLVIRSNEQDRELSVTGYKTLPLRREQEIITKLNQVNLIASSVGQKGLPSLCALLKKALPLRDALSPPLDLILAENIREGAEFCRNLIGEVKGIEKLGLVETSIGKMVPLLSKEEREKDPLKLFAESYNTLILDRDGFLGNPPQSKDIKLVSPIKAYVDRKLFIHNLGHAAAAYLGRAAHPEKTMIWEVLEDANLKSQVKETMEQAAAALLAEYPGVFTERALKDHINDLLDRFSNRALGDTVYRVGRDLKRKLSTHDRVMGAISLAEKYNLPHDAIERVRDRAFHFGKSEPSDEEDRLFSLFHN
jgi:mannitol-1-phosphate 5-dehydrogenase